MKKKLSIFAMLLAITFFWLPGDSNSVAAQNGQGKGHGNHGIDNNSRVWQPGKHKGTWRKKNSYGYKNYGQYRRTQVGNRRYHLVRRYYMNDGIRRSRWVRVYY